MKTAPMQGARALADDGIHKRKRNRETPHLWFGERCARCWMHKDWPGARYGCEGTSMNRLLLCSATTRARKRAYDCKRRAKIKADPALAAKRRAQIKASVQRHRAKLKQGG